MYQTKRYTGFSKGCGVSLKGYTVSMKRYREYVAGYTCLFKGYVVYAKRYAADFKRDMYLFGKAGAFFPAHGDAAAPSRAGCEGARKFHLAARRNIFYYSRSNVRMKSARSPAGQSRNAQRGGASSRAIRTGKICGQKSNTSAPKAPRLCLNES
jgi:hypothetical protein